MKAGLKQNTFLTVMRKSIITIFYALCLAIGYILAFLLRFDFQIPSIFQTYMLITLIPLVAFQTVFLVHFKLHKELWKYVTIHDVARIFTAILAGLVLFILVIYISALPLFLPRGIFALDLITSFLLLTACMTLVRILYEFRRKRKSKTAKNVLIFGAGRSGQLIAKELLLNKDLGYIPRGFIDDNIRIIDNSIMGIPIVGTSSELSEILKRGNYEAIIIAISSLGDKKLNHIKQLCSEYNIELKRIPLLRYLLNGKISMEYQTSHIEDKDIIQRKVVSSLNRHHPSFYHGKICMVSGAGGSIGSELCRQLLKAGIDKLIMVDHSENNLFNIQYELENSEYKSKVVSFIGDVKNRFRMEEIITNHKPHIFFHAAAYKHVPLMECNPIEAFQNNVIGTLTVCDICYKANIENFVLISTDKAVNPVNIMGMTKRLAEEIILGYSKKPNSKTLFSAVRFGNVMDSSGSVLEIFRKQLAAGGPLTVTHPDVKRFFMTIPEAVELVLCAAELAEGGDIFVLEMGKQIKIIDIAKRMIELAGLEPDSIPIQITGLRPGEKLEEELFSEDENISTTGNPYIRRILFENNRKNIFETIEYLDQTLHKGEKDFAVNLKKAVVDLYKHRKNLKNDLKMVASWS